MTIFSLPACCKNTAEFWGQAFLIKLLDFLHDLSSTHCQSGCHSSFQTLKELLEGPAEAAGTQTQPWKRERCDWNCVLWKKTLEGTQASWGWVTFEVPWQRDKRAVKIRYGSLCHTKDDGSLSSPPSLLLLPLWPCESHLNMRRFILPFFTGLSWG